MMSLQSLLEKTSDADLRRQMFGFSPPRRRDSRKRKIRLAREAASRPPAQSSRFRQMWYDMTPLRKSRLSRHSKPMSAKSVLSSPGV